MKQWLMGAESAIGYPHKLALEDAYAYHQRRDGFYGVIADGAGSAKQASFAAQWVVKEGMDLLEDSFQGLSSASFSKIATHCLENLQQGLRLEAKISGLPLDDYGCTVLLFLMKKGALFLVQVGDGFVVTGWKGSYMLKLLGPKGQHVNETNFLTDSTLKVQTLVIEEPLDFLAIGTDGLESVGIERKEKRAFEGFFKPFDTYLASGPTSDDIQNELRAFLTSPALLERSRDDKTLFIAKALDA